MVSSIPCEMASWWCELSLSLKDLQPPRTYKCKGVAWVGIFSRHCRNGLNSASAWTKCEPGWQVEWNETQKLRSVGAGAQPQGQPPGDAMGICRNHGTCARLPQSTKGGFEPILPKSEKARENQLTSATTYENNNICNNSHNNYNLLSAHSVPGSLHLLLFISIY